MYDVNAEHMGWNKEPNEKAADYIKRVWNDDYLETVDNNAFFDMSPERSMEMNDLCQPIEGCYYFSYTTGVDQKVGNDRVQPEINPEIKHFTNDVIGFDVENINRLQWQDVPRNKGKETFCGKLVTVAKQAMDPVFTYCHYFIKRYKYDLPKIYEQQKENKNWDTLKWDHERWHEDTDTLVTRYSQEFPRMSHKYTSISSEVKPWGTKAPEQFNWEDNPKMTRFEKGRWFYTAIENSTHLDLCGWPIVTPFHQLRVLFGVENRFEFFQTLFERLYALEFN